METVRTSETWVNFNVTIWSYIPEDSKLNFIFVYLYYESYVDVNSLLRCSTNGWAYSLLTPAEERSDVETVLSARCLYV
jgi:hypothetical protein